MRLIVDGPGDGAWNMAIDEVLLETVQSTNRSVDGPAADSGCVSLRVYRWTEPTLSLGYFQSYADRNTHAASAHCPTVRRATGGGAILHDCELTYCIAIPAKHQLARRPVELYSRVHRALGRMLETAGVATTPHEASATPSGTSTPHVPFLCYHRRSPFDLVQGEHKIVGSAQRRKRGAVLQQGSVLLAASAVAPDVPGPVYRSAVPSFEELLDLLPHEVSEEFGWTVESDSLTDQELRRASDLMRLKYDHESWTRRR